MNRQRPRDLAAPMTERQLQQAVMDLARLLGLDAHHNWTSIHSPAGFPDIVIVGPRGVLFAELKSAVGRVSAPQARWLTALEAVASPQVIVRTWRPSDWICGEVESVLRMVAG